MSIQKEIDPGQRYETRRTPSEVVDVIESPAPRKMTFAENLVLTIKVLAGFGLLGAVLWGINVWTAAR